MCMILLLTITCYYLCVLLGWGVAANLIDSLKVSVNENFSTLSILFFFLDFWHEWVLNFILSEKENQKVLFNPSKVSLFCFLP